MEKKYTVKVYFLLEVEAENSNEAIDRANHLVRFGTYDTEPRYLNLAIQSVKKPIEQATATEEVQQPAAVEAPATLQEPSSETPF